MLCVLACCNECVCRVTVTDNIRILVKDAEYTSIPTSDKRQSAHLYTSVRLVTT